jgi:hypothetical protein
MSFEDNEFPATKGSLYIVPPNKGNIKRFDAVLKWFFLKKSFVSINWRIDDVVVSWKRPKEYCKEAPALYVDGSSEGDVQQVFILVYLSYFFFSCQ